MDLDSFLNFPSPDMNDFGDWGRFPDVQAEDWNPIRDEPAQIEPLDSLMPRAKHASYSPILRLSDIASALQGFSMASPLRIAPTARTSSKPPEPVRKELPQCLQAVAHNTQDDLDSDENEDVKPFVVPSPIFHKRPLNVPEQCFSAAKRAKLAPANPSGPQDSAILRERQLMPTSKEGLSQRVSHIHSERQRRRSMRDYFTTLQSLIPKVKLKHTDRITVLTEVITYIQSLRGTLEELDRKKAGILELLGFSSYQAEKECDAMSFLDRLKGCASEVQDVTTYSMDVTVRLSGSDLLITLSTPKRKGVWSAVLMLLQRYRVEVVNATLETSGERNFHCIRGKVANVAEIESVDLQDKLEELIVKELRRRPRRL